MNLTQQLKKREKFMVHVVMKIKFKIDNYSQVFNSVD
jgi:hypothetical protein